MMKKKLLAILLLSLLTVAACSSKDDANEKADTSKQEEKQTEETSGAVAVDKGLLNVEVTIPASFMEGEDIDAVVAEAKEDGIKDVKKNQLFEGIDAEKLNVTIETVDHSTGEVFGTVNYPEAFEDTE